MGIFGFTEKKQISEGVLNNGKQYYHGIRGFRAVKELQKWKKRYFRGKDTVYVYIYSLF